MEAPADGSAPGYRWGILAMLVANFVSGTLLFVSLGLMLPGMLQEIAMTPVQQGWLSSSQLLGMAVLSIPAAWWFSRYNARAVASVANLAGALLVFGQAAAPGYLTLLAARTGFGLTGLANQPAGTMLIRQWFSDQDIVLVNGIYLFVIGIAEFGAAVGTPLLVDLMGGWRPVLAVIAAWALVSAVLWLVFGRERLTDKYQASLAALERPPVWSVVRYRALWLACAGPLGTMAVWTAFGTFWPSYMHQRHSLPLTTLGLVFGLISLGQAPAGLCFGYLASRWGVGRGILMGCGVVMALFSMVLLLTTSVPLLLLAGTMVGLSWGYVPIVTTIPYKLPGVTPREIAVAMSLLSSMFALGGTVGPVVAGVLVELTGSAFLGLALMCLWPLLLTAIGFGLPQRDSPHQEGPGGPSTQSQNKVLVQNEQDGLASPDP